jgi:hypothetical protein
LDHISFRSSSSEEEPPPKTEVKRSALDRKLSEVLEYESEISSNYIPRECRKLLLEAPANSRGILSDIPAVDTYSEKAQPSNNYLLELIQSLSLQDPSIQPLAKVIVPMAAAKQGDLEIQKQLLKIQEIA